MLRICAAELTTTERASSFVSVLNRNESMGFGFDYCLPNALNVHKGYFVAKMADCIDSLKKTNICLELVASSKYWQVRTDEKDFNNTAFVTDQRLYRHKNMPPEWKSTLQHVRECQAESLSLSKNIRPLSKVGRDYLFKIVTTAHKGG